MKKLIAFDLDDTLAITKSPISDRMAGLLSQLLDHFEVCIISGAKFELFTTQVVSRMAASPEQLNRLHLMPTTGTSYYRYDSDTNDWAPRYQEDLTPEQKQQIVTVLEASARQLGYWTESPAGEMIEDRGSQVTLSALGQQATAEDKYAWDPDGTKKHAIRALAAESLPGLEVRAAGTTSIDVTKPGIDKAYGMRKMIEALEITQDEILFFGDKLEEGGNDYPVRAMGVDCIAVKRWEDTAIALEAILYTR